MAEIFNEETGTFEGVPTARLRTGKQGRVSSYPWHLWLDGRIWRLERGVDFVCTLATFKTLITNQASRRMVLVWTRQVGDRGLVMQRKGVRVK